MSRKNKRSADNRPAEKPSKASPENAGGGITARGARLLAVAVIVIAAGYFSLSKAGPAGRDSWSNLAALLLTGGYLLIPFAIMAGKSGSGESPPL